MLDPGLQGDPLRGTLEVVPINAAGCYEALSYVWAEPGPRDCADQILLRDGEGCDAPSPLVLTGGSIIAALHQVRHRNRARRLWADQCCINQHDMEERSSQVQHMNRIYRDAARILVWLGLDNEQQAGNAFDLIRELDEILGHRPTDSVSAALGAAGLETCIRENHTALQALANRGWVSLTMRK